MNVTTLRNRVVSNFLEKGGLGPDLFSTVPPYEIRPIPIFEIYRKFHLETLILVLPISDLRNSETVMPTYSNNLGH